MKQTRRLAAALLAALTLLAGATVARGEDLKATLTDLYAKTAQAVDTKNYDAVAAFMTDDYVTIAEGGKEIDRATTLDNLKKGLAPMETVSSTYEIEDIKDDNGVLEVTVKNHMQATFKDPKGKAHEIVTDGITKDYWVSTPTGYKIKKTVASGNSKTTIDGQEQH